MGRFHKTSHGPRKRKVVAYSIVAHTKKHEPSLNQYGMPSGYKTDYKYKSAAQKVVAKLRKTKMYKSIKIVELRQ
jgi:hypothetical protein